MQQSIHATTVNIDDIFRDLKAEYKVVWSKMRKNSLDLTNKTKEHQELAKKMADEHDEWNKKLDRFQRQFDAKKNQ